MSDPKGPNPKDVVRRFFDTLGTGDFAAIGEFFTDESVWQVNDVARGLPAQHGRKGIIDDFLQPIREGLFEPGDPKVEIRRLIGEGDWVVAETTGRARSRSKASMMPTQRKPVPPISTPSASAGQAARIWA